MVHHVQFIMIGQRKIENYYNINNKIIKNMDILLNKVDESRKKYIEKKNTEIKDFIDEKFTSKNWKNWSSEDVYYKRLYDYNFPDYNYTCTDLKY
jgi:hypothetical protein